MRTNYMMTVDDVMEELGVKRSKAYSILKQLNDELAKEGYVAVRGKIPRPYWETKFYGFFQFLQYFLMDNYDGEEIIRLGLEKKLDAMVNREVYSKSKTAPTEEEREKFRQEYLDRRGIPENFRW